MSAAHAAIMGRAATLDSRIAALAGIQPIITGAMNINQAWVRGSPCAVAAIPGWGFTRAGPGFGERPDLTLEPFASGAPRLVNGRGQLIEGARTNLCLRSQEFDSASWTKSRGSITADQIAAPDGTLTADKFTEDSASGTHRIFQTVTKAASAIQYTVSAYFKAGTRTFAQLRCFSVGEINGCGVAINLSTGALSATYGPGFTGVSVTSTSLADGWFRVALTFTTDTDTTLNTFLLLATDLTAASPSYVGDGVSFAYFWGAQIEAAAFPSSYIPTTTTSVTRPADIPLIDISAYSPAITYPLTMYARFERVVDTGTLEIFLQADAGSNNDTVTMFVSASDLMQTNVVTATVTQAQLISAASVPLGSAVRVASRVATNSARQCFSGTLGTEDTSVTTPASPSRIQLTRSDFPPFGYLSEFAIIPGAVSDANLVRLAA